MIETGKRCADHLVGSVSHNIAVSVQGNHELGQQQHLWLCAHSEGLGGQNLVCRVLLATHTHTPHRHARAHTSALANTASIITFLCAIFQLFLILNLSDQEPFIFMKYQRLPHEMPLVQKRICVLLTKPLIVLHLDLDTL